VSPTLNAFDNAHETRATVLILDVTRVDDVRVYEDGISHCLMGRMGTGGNQMPIVATDPVLAFDGYNQPVTENVYRALRIGIDSGDCVAIPIQDGRDMEKKQNGLGIGEEGDPMYTLDQTGAQSVAIPIQGTIIGRSETAGPQGRGAGEPGDPMYTLDTVSQHGVEHMMQVRRLTPIECERLMGWPDNHTATGTNGPVSDTNRYKMCGNGVASPVAEWIGLTLMATRPDAE
jgi:DNA (cytosine-5)-methyltransferase 1